MGNNDSKSLAGHNVDIKDSLISLESLSNERGVAFIVSNKYLCGDKQLHSSDEDAKKMEVLFLEKEINYSVHVRNQVTVEKFVATCKYLATYEYYPPTCEAIVIYFAGHGGNGFITMEAEKEKKSTRVNILELRSMFTNTEIANIFFIDTCRGSGSDSSHTGIVTTNTESTNEFSATGNQSKNMSNNDSTTNHASQGNDLIAYATSEGFVAYCYKDGGSWTKTLVLQLGKLRNEDIHSVLTKVNGLMKYKQHGTKDPKFQTPECRDRLTKKIYLWPQSGK